MSASSCPICLEGYQRDHNPPLSLAPCGHVVCDPCWRQWSRQHRVSRPTCPHCRVPVTNALPNRDLLDLLETINRGEPANTATATTAHDGGVAPTTPPTAVPPQRSSVGSVLEGLFAGTQKRRDQEILSDRCHAVFYVLDNSGSMQSHDGKRFIDREDGTVGRAGCTRWTEMATKMTDIVEYNCRRGIKAAYYLLNPRRPAAGWIEDVDFVVIDPLVDPTHVTDARRQTLLGTLLNPGQIRSSTPLHVITEHFTQQLRHFVGTEDYVHTPICYNIMTDGEPDDKRRFEASLRTLTSKYHVFLVVNLCTDNDDVVEYYNDLDRKLGSELSGMDVIDDLLSEQQEITNAGNRFFVYSKEIHTCRMAGCYSIAADLLDEATLPIHYMALFCKDVVATPATDRDTVPHWSDTDAFIAHLERGNRKVYDIATRTFRHQLDISAVKHAIWLENTKRHYKELSARLWARYKMYIIAALVLLMALVYNMAMKLTPVDVNSRRR